MTSVGFKPTISAGERPQTYALERAATGTGKYIYIYIFIYLLSLSNLSAFTAPFRCHFHDLVLEAESESSHDRRGIIKSITFIYEIIPVCCT
jgi:hypothetical protein